MGAACCDPWFCVAKGHENGDDNRSTKNRISNLCTHKIKKSRSPPPCRPTRTIGRTAIARSLLRERCAQVPSPYPSVHLSWNRSRSSSNLQLAHTMYAAACDLLLAVLLLTAAIIGCNVTQQEHAVRMCSDFWHWYFGSMLLQDLDVKSDLAKAEFCVAASTQHLARWNGMNDCLSWPRVSLAFQTPNTTVIPIRPPAAVSFAPASSGLPRPQEPQKRLVFPRPDNAALFM